VPQVRENNEHVFHLYIARVDDRDAFRDRLAAAGVQTALHYPLPVHRQPAYAERVRIATSMSVTDQAADRIVSLPLFPELAAGNVERVIQATLAACEI